MLYEKLTDRIIGCYYEIYNIPEYGFLEKIYENAMMIKLRKSGFNCIQQPPIEVYFENTHKLIKNYHPSHLHHPCSKKIKI